MREVLFSEVIQHGSNYQHIYRPDLNGLKVICPECNHETEDFNGDFYKKFHVLKENKPQLNFADRCYTMECVRCHCVFEIVI